MTRHIKAEVRASKRNDEDTKFLDPGLEIWSNGPPYRDIQVVVGDTRLMVSAVALIDAIRRCSNIEG